jgi:hypothetical protein
MRQRVSAALLTMSSSLRPPKERGKRLILALANRLSATLFRLLGYQVLPPLFGDSAAG